MARAGRDEYKRIRNRMRQANVVHVDETGMNTDGEQGWL
jgi:transposase-like protein